MTIKTVHSDIPQSPRRFEEGKKTLFMLLKEGETYLQSHDGSGNARLEAEVLLSALLNCSRLDLYLRFDARLDPTHEKAYYLMLQRRSRHEPLQYITGMQWFFNRLFKVGPGVLIPRPETELLVLEALSHLKEGPVMDLGTGSGCIAISLLLEGDRKFQCMAIDRSQKALDYAEENARRHQVSHRIHLMKSDLFKSLPEIFKNSFEMIVSNPPYLDLDHAQIEPGVREYEPLEALDGGVGGLSYYIKIFNEADNWLKPGGFLILEMGFDQIHQVLDLLKQYPSFELLKITKDDQGIERILSLVYHKSSPHG